MIYTSYFSNIKNLDINDCLSISIGTPNWFKGNIYKNLQPTWDIVMGHKNKTITDDEYTKIYYETILNKLDINKTINELDNKILLCWCGKNKFCHRHIVSNWLNNFKKNMCLEI